MVSRIATSLPKLWALTIAPLVSRIETPMAASLRRLSTGKDNRRFVDHKGDLKALDCFLGKWEEVSRSGHEKFAEAAGIKGEVKKLLLDNKTKLSYARKGDKWTHEIGIQNHPENMVFHFKLGESYNSKNFDGSHLKGLISKHGNKLVGRYEKTDPSRTVIQIVTDVKGNTLTSVATIKGVTMESIYKKK